MPDGAAEPNSPATALVHLASGIGNMVLATPLLIALGHMGFVVDLLTEADYPQTVDLFRNWSIIRGLHHCCVDERYEYIIPAVPPFYSSRLARDYSRDARIVPRPPDWLFYQDEQEYYLDFARRLGYPAGKRPWYSLPIAAADSFGVGPRTLVLAPGCKTGEMAAKRWPYFPQLARAFEDVAIVGTADDMRDHSGSQFSFPPHVRVFVDTLTLRETAELLAAAGAAVGNDSGLCHIAGAVGTPTVMIFGPTPHLTLGRLPPNVRVIRAGLSCEACWFGSRFQECSARINCLRHVAVGTVEQELRSFLGP